MLKDQFFKKIKKNEKKKAVKNFDLTADSKNIKQSFKQSLKLVFLKLLPKLNTSNEA